MIHLKWTIQFMLSTKFIWLFFLSLFRILIEESIRSLANQGKCKVPILSHDAPEMMKFIKDEPPINCSSTEDWATCYLSTCSIKKHIIDLKGGLISCEFTDIIRKDDYKIEYGATVRSTHSYVLQTSDIVRVKCKAADGSRWTFAIKYLYSATSIKSFLSGGKEL